MITVIENHYGNRVPRKYLNTTYLRRVYFLGIRIKLEARWA